MLGFFFCSFSAKAYANINPPVNLPQPGAGTVCSADSQSDLPEVKNLRESSHRHTLLPSGNTFRSNTVFLIKTITV